MRARDKVARPRPFASELRSKAAGARWTESSGSKYGFHDAFRRIVLVGPFCRSDPAGKTVNRSLTLRGDGERCRKTFEPLSGSSRTGLRHPNPEIGKWRAETAALKPAARELEFEDLLA